MQKRISLIGGDMRNVRLAELLDKKGFDVFTFGVEGVKTGKDGLYRRCNSLKEAVARGDIVVGPTPFTTDGVKIHAPLHNSDVSIEDFIRSLGSGQLVVSGKIPCDHRKRIENAGAEWEDLLNREDMAILNSVATAEGAVQIAMEELPVTIHNLKVCLLGYGKVGTRLADVLQSLGADVTVAVRSSRDVARCGVRGFKVCSYGDLGKTASKTDLMINTVPALVITPEVLDWVGSDTLVIDLASSPGGVDYTYAAQKGIRAIQALSLPGKVAPLTAAENMCRAIENIISERSSINEFYGS